MTNIGKVFLSATSLESSLTFIKLLNCFYSFIQKFHVQVSILEHSNTCLKKHLYILCCCRCRCQVTSVVSDSVRPHRRQPTRLPIPVILQARTLEWVAISFSIYIISDTEKLCVFGPKDSLKC